MDFQGKYTGAELEEILGKVKVMKGATPEAAGEAGLTPAPSSKDRLKYVRGDGTFGWPSLSSRIQLTSDDDIDMVKDIGVYTWVSTDYPANTPFEGVGTMTVFLSFDEDSPYRDQKVVQTIYSVSGRMFVRYSTSAGWGEWYRMVTDKDLDNTFYYRGDITTADDMDDVNDIGVWSFISSEKPINRPFDNGGLIAVFPHLRKGGDIGRVIQMAMNPDGKIKFRYRRNSGYGEWMDITPSSSPSPILYNDRRRIEAFVRKSRTVWTPLGDIPKNTVECESYEGNVTGLPYSSVFHNTNDIYYHRGLSAFYSAVKNKGSVLYVEGYGCDSPRPTSMGCYYGVVCSSFVCKVTGQRIYWKTQEMSSILEFYDYVDIEQLNIGDVMLADGHCKIISNIEVDDEGSYSVEITEQGQITSLVYDQEGFEGILRGEDSHDSRPYRIGRFPKQGALAVLPKIQYSENVISEYGDRTYFHKGSDIYVMVANGDHLDIALGETVNRVALSELTTKTVNDTVMYDIAPYMTEVGDYEVYVDNDPVRGMLSVIDTGTVTLDGDIVTLAGYGSNSVPDWYEIVYLQEREADEYSFYPAPEGYVGYGVNLGKGLVDGHDVFKIDISRLESYASGYYVRCYYSTKFGLACEDSNVVMIGG